MKIYTDEQVKKAIDMAREYYDGFSYTEKEIIATVTPIELPSDDKINKESYEGKEIMTFQRAAFIMGAKWMKEQILNQNK